MSARDCILVTGGAGFIGSHFARLADEAGSQVISIDEKHTDWWKSSSRIQRRPIDIADSDDVKDLITRYNVTSVVHFASDICVSESVKDPARYFDRNVIRSLGLLEAVRAVGPTTFVFSSSAAVYGHGLADDHNPGAAIPDQLIPRPINAYGATKLAIEHALEAYGKAYGLRWLALRYFNAAGAHPDGTMCEAHKPETHLIPLAIDAAIKGPPLTIYGKDYPTRDGTCIRDYVHVMDIAQAHLDALDALDRTAHNCSINLGSGTGYTVREVLEIVGEQLGYGREVPHTFGPRRDGDPAILLADITRARTMLGWNPEHSDLETIVRDAVRSRQV